MFPCRTPVATPLVIVILISGLFAVPGRAGSSPDGDAHDPALLTALSHFHEDPSDAVLDGFEPGLLEALLAIVSDESVPRLARVRALAALGRYPEASSAFEATSTIARDVDGDVRLRIAAVGTLGQRLGHAPEAVPVLADVLEDADPGLRALAVEALSTIGTPEADALLSRHRIKERHVLVRRALRGAREAQLGRSLPPEGPIRPVTPPRLEGVPVIPPSLEGVEEER
jgi:hypothetical protein